MEIPVSILTDTTRTQIYLTGKERKFFRKIAYEQETTMSEAIREVLDKHIDKEGDIKNG